MATPSMESIKKKMQTMKMEKDNAHDRADQHEQKAKELEEKQRIEKENQEKLRIQKEEEDKQ